MLTICICNQFWNKCHTDIEQLTQNISVRNKRLNQQFLSACLFGLFQPRSQGRKSLGTRLGLFFKSSN